VTYLDGVERIIERGKHERRPAGALGFVDVCAVLEEDPDNFSVACGACAFGAGM
jgi:hypothetical protein